MLKNNPEPPRDFLPPSRKPLDTLLPYKTAQTMITDLAVIVTKRWAKYRSEREVVLFNFKNKARALPKEKKAKTPKPKSEKSPKEKKEKKAKDLTGFLDL